MVEYVHSPLADGGIRVLELLPGYHAAGLQAEVNEWQTVTSGSFDALSYVWDGEIKPCQIGINGATLRITNSLDSALRRLRDPKTPRVLWVDAVCINQGNVEERAQQVALMPAIYSSAQRVIVDLGEETEDRKKALRTMDQLWRKHIWTGLLVTGKTPTPEETAAYLGVDLLTDRKAALAVQLPQHHAEWGCVHRFLARPWFSRLWSYRSLSWPVTSSLSAGRSSRTGRPFLPPSAPSSEAVSA